MRREMLNKTHAHAWATEIKHIKYDKTTIPYIQWSLDNQHVKNMLKMSEQQGNRCKLSNHDTRLADFLERDTDMKRPCLSLMN